MVTRPDADDVGVVVLPREASRLVVPGERSPNPLDFVRRDLLAVARAANDDAETAGFRDCSSRGVNARLRIVVLWVVRQRSAVDWIMTELGKPLQQPGLELESGMITSEKDA